MRRVQVLARCHLLLLIEDYTLKLLMQNVHVGLRVLKGALVAQSRKQVEGRLTAFASVLSFPHG